MSETGFISKDDELEFWRNKAKDFQRELLIVQDEFQNYESSSRELEQELELQLNDYESRNRNLIIANEKLNLELENTVIRLSETTINFNHQIIEYQDEISRLKNEKSTLQKYVRELEQLNDDLERGKRVTVMSLQDFEEKLNIAIEKNAILENELEEKETLVETVQRLKEEARDLRQDLLVKEMTLNQQVQKTEEDLEALATSMIEETNDSQMCHKIQVSCQTDWTVLPDAMLPLNGVNESSPGFINYRASFSQINSNSRPSYFANNHSYNSLTPAARISALNLVSDMLKKVGAIEHKLTSATHRDLSECESRTPSRHRLSESVFLNGYMRLSDNDAFQSDIAVTPVASPIKSYYEFEKSSNPLTQSVVE